MTDTDQEALDLDAETEGRAENFIAANPLTALGIALFLGALAARVLMHPAQPVPARRHDPLPE